MLQINSDSDSLAFYFFSTITEFPESIFDTPLSNKQERA